MRGPEFMMLWSLAWVFGWCAVLIVVWHVRNRNRQKRLELIHKERMMAMEKGVPLPEVPSLENGRNEAWWGHYPVNPRWPLGLGAILVFAGLGVALAFFVSGYETLNRLWSLGFIGIFLGVGLFLHYLLTQRGKS